MVWYVEFSIKIDVESVTLYTVVILMEMGQSFSWHIVVIGGVWERPGYVISLSLLIPRLGLCEN